MHSQKIKAFTLVELIIVITILAILATIGFMSFQTYTGDTRDTKRKTDLGVIRKGLEIYQLKNQILPKPEEQLLTIKTGSLIVSYQGYLGKEIQKTLRLTSETKDSKDNTYYTYSTNGNQTKYQLLAMLENNPNNISFNNILNNNEILNKAFSLDYTNRYSYTIGNKLGIFLSGTTNEPLQETLTGVDLSGTTPTYKIVFNTTSGNITSSGSDLYTQIINNQGTGGTATQVNSCTTQPAYTNAIFTIGTPTSVGQAWQNTNSSNPCYYSCTGGYSGNDCSSKVNIVDFFGDGSGKALYRFENNANDTSGNYNGTANNLTYNSGKFSTGGNFNGTNTYITNSNFYTYTSGLSISMYFKTLSSSRQSLLFISNGNGGWSDGIEISNSTTMQFCFGGGTKYISLTVPNISDGNYHHVVATYNGTTPYIYIDSIQYSGTIGTSNSRIYNGLLIGTTPQTPQYFLSGSLDQIRIFNRSLSQSEVTQLYNE